MRRLLIVAISCIIGCTQQQETTKCIESPQIINRQLKENIETYAAARVAESKKWGNPAWRESNIIALNHWQESDTTVYKIRETCIGDIIGPDQAPICMIRSNDVYIAYFEGKRLHENFDVQMPVKAVIDFMAPDFPEYIDQYKEYLKRTKISYPPGHEGYPFWAFDYAIIEGEYWILKFVDDELAYRMILHELDSSKRIDYFEHGACTRSIVID